MKALLINPMETPQTIEIDNSLESLQKAVGGLIQAVYPWEDPVALVCNDEGKINGLMPNRLLFTEDGLPYDYIAGNFLICGIDDEIGDFASLPEAMIAKYTKLFQYPEIFF